MTALVFLLGVYVGGCLPMLAIGAMAQQDLSEAERERFPAYVVWAALTWPARLYKWAGNGR